MNLRHLLLLFALGVSSCFGFVAVPNTSPFFVASTPPSPLVVGLPPVRTLTQTTTTFDSLRPQRRKQPQQFNPTILLGLVLAFNSGFVNGCCLSGFVGSGGGGMTTMMTQSVAAVTASWTGSALSAARGDGAACVWLLKVIGSYMGGSVVAGFWNPDNTAADRHVALRPLAMGSLFLCLACHALGRQVRAGFLFCAAANGLQNSVTSTLTGNLCRTSHYTGLTSDLGTMLGQWMRRHQQGDALHNKDSNISTNAPLFLGHTACFWMGG